LGLTWCWGASPQLLLSFNSCSASFKKFQKPQNKKKEGIKCAARAKPFCNAIQSSPNKFDRAEITKSYFYCSLSLFSIPFFLFLRCLYVSFDACVCVYTSGEQISAVCRVLTAHGVGIYIYRNNRFVMDGRSVSIRATRNNHAPAEIERERKRRALFLLSSVSFES
jgi:hypothetical protein